MNSFSISSFGYFFITVISIVSLFIYNKFYYDKTEKIYKYVFGSVITINFGYFLLSISRNTLTAIIANDISYFGSISLLVSLLFSISKLCGIKVGKSFRIIVYVISLLMFILVFTGGTSIGWYYKSVSINIVNNTCHLVKEYGPLHIIYSIYVFVHFVASSSLIFYSFVLKKNKPNVNPMILIVLVLENIFVWVVERIINIDFELLSISYVITEMVLLLLLKNIEDYKKAITEKVINNKTISVEEIVKGWRTEYGLTERETEILELLVDNIPRNEIANVLYISEHTVKKHTANIYNKLCVSSRNDLLYKLNEEISK